MLEFGIRGDIGVRLRDKVRVSALVLHPYNV